MKKVLFALLCTLFLAGFGAAEGDNPPQGGEQGPGVKAGHEGRPGKRLDPDQLLAKCPDCADLVTQIKVKLAEMKTLDDQIKPLMDAAKQKREAEAAKLKETDPAKYAELQAKLEEHKKKAAGAGQGEQDKTSVEGGKAAADNGGDRQSAPQGHKNKGVGGPDGADREKRMEMMKKNNPEIYELMVKKQALGKEIRELFEKAKVIIDNKK